MIKYLPLTRGRRLALAIGVPLVLVIIAWSGLNWVALAGQDSYQVKLSLPLTGSIAGLSVDQADLTVGQVAASSRIRVTGTVDYSLVHAKVTWQRTSSGVNVALGCRLPAGVCGGHLAIAVPAGARTRIYTGDGDLTLLGLTGSVSASSGSGNVHASGLPGSASLGDGSGDIVASAVTGPRLTLQDSSGNIIITGLASGQVTASDGSGDVTLTFSKIPSRVHVSDSSGNVTLILPPGRTLYHVTAHSDSGNSQVNVPSSSASHRVITVTDGSGDINIRN